MQGRSILKMTLLALAVALVGGMVSVCVQLFFRSGFSAPDVDFRAPLNACPAPTIRPDLSMPVMFAMQAVATNDRHLAGARCPGSLIGPTVRMLA